MPKIDGLIVVRKKIPVFILAEKSNDAFVSTRIDEALATIKNTLGELGNSPDFEVVVGTYSFSTSDTCFRPKKLQELGDYSNEFIADDSCVDLTNVLFHLNEDMSRKTMMNSETGYMIPWVLLVVDGSKKYCGHEQLECNMENKWFARARRIVITLNDISDDSTNVIFKFASHSESIITFDNQKHVKKLLLQLMVYVSITGSMIAPRSLTNFFNGGQDFENDDIVTVDPIDNGDAWDDEWDWN